MSHRIPPTNPNQGTPAAPSITPNTPSQGSAALSPAPAGVQANAQLAAASVPVMVSSAAVAISSNSASSLSISSLSLSGRQSSSLEDQRRRADFQRSSMAVVSLEPRGPSSVREASQSQGNSSLSLQANSGQPAPQSAASQPSQPLSLDDQLRALLVQSAQRQAEARARISSLAASNNAAAVNRAPSASISAPASAPRQQPSASPAATPSALAVSNSAVANSAPSASISAPASTPRQQPSASPAANPSALAASNGAVANSAPSASPSAAPSAMGPQPAQGSLYQQLLEISRRAQPRDRSAAANSKDSDQRGSRVAANPNAASSRSAPSASAGSSLQNSNALQWCEISGLPFSQNLIPYLDELGRRRNLREASSASAAGKSAQVTPRSANDVSELYRSYFLLLLSVCGQHGRVVGDLRRIVDQHLASRQSQSSAPAASGPLAAKELPPALSSIVREEMTAVLKETLLVTIGSILLDNPGFRIIRASMQNAASASSNSSAAATPSAQAEVTPSQIADVLYRGLATRSFYFMFRDFDTYLSLLKKLDPQNFAAAYSASLGSIYGARELFNLWNNNDNGSWIACGLGDVEPPIDQISPAAISALFHPFAPIPQGNWEQFNDVSKENPVLDFDANVPSLQPADFPFVLREMGPSWQHRNNSARSADWRLIDVVKYVDPNDREYPNNSVYYVQRYERIIDGCRYIIQHQTHWSFHLTNGKISSISRGHAAALVSAKFLTNTDGKEGKEGKNNEV